jgi:hypothetical protein
MTTIHVIASAAKARLMMDDECLLEYRIRPFPTADVPWFQQIKAARYPYPPDHMIGL